MPGRPHGLAFFRGFPDRKPLGRELLEPFVSDIQSLVELLDPLRYVHADRKFVSRSPKIELTPSRGPGVRKTCRCP
jgi:hypothetical protein